MKSYNSGWEYIERYVHHRKVVHEFYQIQSETQSIVGKTEILQAKEYLNIMMKRKTSEKCGSSLQFFCSWFLIPISAVCSSMWELKNNVEYSSKIGLAAISCVFIPTRDFSVIHLYTIFCTGSLFDILVLLHYSMECQEVEKIPWIWKCKWKMTDQRINRSVIAFMLSYTRLCFIKTLQFLIFNSRTVINFKSSWIDSHW